MNGLYGTSGVLPADLVIQSEPKTLDDFLSQPSLLRFKNSLRLTTSQSLDLFGLCGIVVSLFSLIFRIRNAFIFALLWILYLSCFYVGQTFLWFQWDILLLETGFLTIFVAPLLTSRNFHDNVMMWLVKWLLFRLMFASGIVKLTSGCPTWWGLTALNWHFESQCIPTPLAWFCHHLPGWFLELSTAATFIIEIAFPFLYFLPTHARFVAFAGQVILMASIQLSGNYNFFNFITVVLSLPLLYQPVAAKANNSGFLNRCFNTLLSLWTILLSFTGLGFVVYFSIVYFNLKYDSSTHQILSEIAFSEKEFTKFLEWITPKTITFAAVLLLKELATSLIRSFVWPRGFFSKTFHFLHTLLYCAIAIFLFSITLVNVERLTVTKSGSLGRQSFTILPSTVRYLHRWSSQFRLTSSYGLFRRMTGVGGRPELVIEGSNSAEGPWEEYHFLYKPGDLSNSPVFVAPHQPRLDWQMWFAALGNAEHNPWFLNLVYRLLQGKKDVLELLNDDSSLSRWTSTKAPPKFIRATLWTYHYTKPKSKEAKDGNWWTREKPWQYLPPVSLEDKGFQSYIEESGLSRIDKLAKEEAELKKVSSGIDLPGLLSKTRAAIGGQPEGFKFILTLLLSVLLLILIQRKLFGVS